MLCHVSHIRRKINFLYLYLYAETSLKYTSAKAETNCIKGHMQRIFLNLLLFCMLTEYVQSIILLKPA